MGFETPSRKLPLSMPQRKLRRGAEAGGLRIESASWRSRTPER
jgi:hypothetical protein